MKRKCKCKRCGFEWEPLVEDPRACPRCKSYEWKTEKARGGK
jgi:predicted Zn-ribbon and HTH transcriptional regulator